MSEFVEVHRVPCKFCGRKFIPESLGKHVGPCEKAQRKPRKVFDAAKQRATEDLNYRQIKQAQKKEVTAPRTHWRQQHMELVTTVRAARGVSAALAAGGPLPPPPPPSLNPDYVQCQYCNRRFNQRAAERHIPFCKDQQSRLPKGKPDPKAQQKRTTQVQYQAPKPKGSSVASASGAPRGGGTAASRIPGPGSRGSNSQNRPGGSREATSTTAGRSTRSTPASGYQTTETYYDTGDNGYYSSHGGGNYNGGVMSTGKALRTGRDVRTYQEARLDAISNARVRGYKSPSTIRGDATRPSYSDPSRPRSGHAGRTHTHPTPPGRMKESDTGYYSSGSEADGIIRMAAGAATAMATPRRVTSATQSKFCHECGTQYPVPKAKFCCECGARRFLMT